MNLSKPPDGPIKVWVQGVETTDFEVKEGVLSLAKPPQAAKIPGFKAFACRFMGILLDSESLYYLGMQNTILVLYSHNGAPKLDVFDNTQEVQNDHTSD